MFNPVEVANEDGLTQEMCAIVHNYENALLLENLIGKAYAGALRIEDSKRNM